jgi:hypothetical protein
MMVHDVDGYESAVKLLQIAFAWEDEFAWRAPMSVSNS